MIKTNTHYFNAIIQSYFAKKAADAGVKDAAAAYLELQVALEGYEKTNPPLRGTLHVKFKDEPEEESKSLIVTSD